MTTSTRTLKQYIQQAGQQAKATECVIYSRSESGVITRHGDQRIDQHGHLPMDQYQHEEHLAGWPERRVFWTNVSGVAVGDAPLKF